jgi:hypothetical protein
MRSLQNIAAADRIEALDTTIFAIQPGHYTDRTSFLRVQRLIRTLLPGYEYLEVGSDIGASLLPHLLDPNCGSAISIDSRPERQADERGVDFHYKGNSTARMLVELGKHAGSRELGKLSTIDADVSEIDSTRAGLRAHLVLIDGEHTNAAAFSDFLGVLPLIHDDALVTFHDANLISDTIQIIERLLIERQNRYSMVILPSCVAVFGFGKFIRAVETELAPHAEPKDAYFVSARRQRHEAVADAVIERAEGLRGRSIAELLAWTEGLEHRLAVAEAGAREATVQGASNIDGFCLRQALDRVQAANAEMQAHLKAVTSSTSWRVTAPIRTAVRLLKGRRT